MIYEYASHAPLVDPVFWADGASAYSAACSCGWSGPYRMHRQDSFVGWARHFRYKDDPAFPQYRTSRPSGQILSL